MDWTNKNIHPSKVVSVGDETEVIVLDIDRERRRISLGIKQCRPNPGVVQSPMRRATPLPALSSLLPIWYLHWLGRWYRWPCASV